MRKYITYSLSLALVLVAAKSYAQIETTSYFMNSLPQYVISNPAFVPKYKFTLGLPVVSSIAATYSNNGFSYSDLIKKESGKTIGDLSKLVNSFSDKNYINTSLQIDLFRLGVRITPKFYLTLNSTVKGYNSMLVPKDMAALFVNGTASYIGKNVTVSPEVQMVSYLENAAGFSFEPIENLRVGARVKLLNGAISAKTETSSLAISVADNYQITAAADMRVKTSGIYETSDFKPGDYLQNKGWGFDLGATYRLLDKITVAASLIDIGQINWKNDTYEYSLDKATANYTFKGLDIDELVNGKSDYSSAQLDSLNDKFKPLEKATGSFKTPLPSKMYLSGSYEVTKSFNVGAILFAEKFYGRINSGLSLAMNKNFGRVLTTSLSYTLSNKSFNNLGAGLSLNLSPLQIYIVGDNLLNAPISIISTGKLNSYINHTQVFTLRTGVNFVFGWAKEQKGKETVNFTSKKKQKATSSDPGYIKLRKKR